MRIAPQTQQQIEDRARRLKETDPLRQALTDIATMPAYDQDDAHRLRHLAKRALDQNPPSPAQQDCRGVLTEFLAAHDAYIDEADEMGAGRLRKAADEARALLQQNH